MRTIVSLTPEDHYLAGLVGGLLAIDSGVTSIIDFAHGQINAETALAAAQGVKDSGISGWYAFQMGVSSSYGPGDSVPLAEAHAQRIAKTTETHWATAERLQKELFSDSSGLMQLSLSHSLAPLMSFGGCTVCSFLSLVLMLSRAVVFAHV